MHKMYCMILLNIIILIVMCSQLEAGKTSRPNFWGGRTYYQDGRYLKQSRPNVFNSKSYYNRNGGLVEQRMNLGGRTIYYRIKR